MYEKELLDEFIGWISVDDRLPKHNKNVLAIDRGHIILARHINYMTEICSDYNDAVNCDYDDDLDEFFLAEGWYEQVSNWDGCISMQCEDAIVSHWQPLPKLPE